MLDGFAVIGVTEGMLGQEENLSRPEAEAQHIIKEEVVQLVRSHEVFGLLGNISLLVNRRQLWRNGGVYDVYQRLTLGLELRQFGDVAHHILDKRLGHAAVDAIHGHMVTVICRPA